VVPGTGATSEDPRLKFFKGWFEETLPGHSVPDHDVMFVNFDADLYSSTKTVLGFLKDQVGLERTSTLMNSTTAIMNSEPLMSSCKKPV
jgi:hypothetical protein